MTRHCRYGTIRFPWNSCQVAPHYGHQPLRSCILEAQGANTLDCPTKRTAWHPWNSHCGCHTYHTGGRSSCLMANSMAVWYQSIISNWLSNITVCLTSLQVTPPFRFRFWDCKILPASFHKVDQLPISADDIVWSHSCGFKVEILSPQIHSFRTTDQNHLGRQDSFPCNAIEAPSHGCPDITWLSRVSCTGRICQHHRVLKVTVPQGQVSRTNTFVWQEFWWCASDNKSVAI